MATNIDTGLTVADAVNADHSPHIFTMSNGDLVAIYYDGTNFVWRSKSGGSWSGKTTITLDTGVTPPQVSYLTRTGDVIFAVVSKDPIDASHNGDIFQLTYTTSTHTLATTNKQIDAADGAEKAAGIGYTSGASANNQVQVLHGAANGGFATVQQLNVNPTIYGTDQVPTFMDYRSSARTGLITDGTTTTYLIYAIGATGTSFAVERFVTSTAADNVESPPAPAANLAGVTAVWDGTNYVFIANENNAKLRYLTRTGTNTYGSWTDILSDSSLTGQPAVCVKSGGDLALFYRTNKNQANGEIWVVQRTGGTWGSPALLAGGAATGWSNPSVAASDLNDSGVARVVYVTGTASAWTLVEDAYTFGGGGSPVAITGEADGVGAATLTLTVSHALTGESDGVGATTLALTVTRAMAGTAAGVGTAAFSLTVSHAIVGEADGVGTASLTPTVSHLLIGESDGVGTASVTLTVSHLITGEADGVGVATLSLNVGAGVHITGEADGVGVATLTPTVSHLLAGSASGVSTATLTLIVSHLLSGQANGAGTVSLALIVAHLLTMRADGVGVATARISAGNAVQLPPPAMPRISLNAPAFGSNITYAPSRADNSTYGDFWRSIDVPSVGSPVYLAYDLSSVSSTQRGKVLVNLINEHGSLYYNTDTSQATSLFTDYQLQGNTAAGGSLPGSGWVDLITPVTGNLYPTRQHTFDFTGYNWLRLLVTASSGNPVGGNNDVSVQMDVHDAHLASTGQPSPFYDAWLFLGDSITTEGALHANLDGSGDWGYGGAIANLINTGTSGAFFPATIDGGNSGMTMAWAATNIANLLNGFSNGFVSLAFGTNDANNAGFDWTAGDTNVQGVYANLKTCIDAALALNNVVVVPKIPDSGPDSPFAGFNGNLVNQYVATQLPTDYPSQFGKSVMIGPDFWTFFANNQNLIRTDSGPIQIHPTYTEVGGAASGYEHMHLLWQAWMLANIYQPAPPPPQIVPGSVSLSDGAVGSATLADALVSRASIGDTAVGMLVLSDA